MRTILKLMMNSGKPAPVLIWHERGQTGQICDHLMITLT